MMVAASLLGTALCYAFAIHLLFIHLCSVQSYFNNEQRFVWHNAGQTREQTSLFRRARNPLQANITAKVIRNLVTGINGKRKEGR